MSFSSHLTRLLCAAVLLAACVRSQAPQCMYTIAGGVGAGYDGEGGSATSAKLFNPWSVALYRGGVLIADRFNHMVRFVNGSSGIITTVVNSAGIAAYSGNGGPARTAALNYPSSVTHFAGGFLIADYGNHAIRFVNGSTNIISTIAGTAFTGFSGDGGPATSAKLQNPGAVAMSGGNIFIADTLNYRIRRVSFNTITSIAGTGVSGYSGDGGPATSATIAKVFGIAMYAGGILIADGDNGRVRCINAGIITTVAGGGGGPGPGQAVSVYLGGSQGVASSGDATFILSESNGLRVRLVDASGFVASIAGAGSLGNSGDGGLATSAQLAQPWGMALDAEGGVLVADVSNNAIRYITPPGMCRPLVNCTVVVPSLLCTFSPVAPYLFLNVSLADSACTLLQFAPAVTRNVSCPLPSSSSATLRWMLGNVVSNMSVVIPSPTPSPLPSASPSPAPPPSCIFTIAGNGAQYTADGTPAATSALNEPWAVVLYRGGYLISEYRGHVVRWVNATSGLISTSVGTGAAGFTGNGGPASSALLNSPAGLAASADGIYVVDHVNQVIRVVSSSSNAISTFAGSAGSQGFSGDGGAATAAMLNLPLAVAVNGSDVYIADSFNFRVRRVNMNRIISTVAGNGTRGFSGDGAAATSASIGWVYSIAVYAGGLLLADLDSSRVRRLDASGIITTVAGGGASTATGPATGAALSLPRSVASDGSLSFIVADTGNSRIRRVDAAGMIATIAGTAQGYSGDGDLATSAQLDGPSGLALDGSGGFLIADQNNNMVRYVTPAGMCRPLVNCSAAAPDLMCVFSSVAPYLHVSVSLAGLPCTLLQFAPATSRTAKCPLPSFSPATLTWTLGSMVDSMSVVVPLSPSCMYTIVGRNGAGYTGDGGPAALASLNSARFVAMYKGGALIADTGNNVIRWINGTSGIIQTLVGSGASSYGGDGGPASLATLSSPSSIAVSAADGFCIADSSNNVIRFVSGNGMISTIAGNGTQGMRGDGEPATDASLNRPGAVAVNGSDVIIADTFNFRIRLVRNAIITTIVGTGSLAYSGDGGAASLARIGYINGIAIYSGGLLLADTNCQRVRRVDRAGIITTVAGGGVGTSPGPATLRSLYLPQGVSSDGSAAFFVADTVNHAVRHVDAAGVMSTIAGAFSSGFTGDGGPATSAQLSSPLSVAADGSGGLLIADYDNHAIRYVAPPGICKPRASCNIAGGRLACSLAPIAPFLHLNATFGGAPCTLLQLAPAMTRNITCPLPSAVAATLMWTVGGVERSMSVAIPSPSPSITPSATWTASPTAAVSSAATATLSGTSSGTASGGISVSVSGSSSATASGSTAAVASISGSPTASASSTLTPVSSMTTSSQTASSSRAASSSLSSSCSISAFISGSAGPQAPQTSSMLEPAATPTTLAPINASAEPTGARESQLPTPFAEISAAGNATLLSTTTDAAPMIRWSGTATIAACSVLGALVIASLLALCWRARSRFSALRAMWLQQHEQHVHEKAGTTPTHSPGVRRMSAAIVSAVMPTLSTFAQLGDESDSVKALQARDPARASAVRSALIASMIKLSSSAPAVVMNSCADVAIEAVRAHIAAAAEARMQRAETMLRPLDASVMRAVSHALQVAEEERLLPVELEPTDGSAVAPGQMMADMEARLSSRMHDALLQRGDAAGASRDTTSAAMQLASALCGDDRAQGAMTTAHDEFMQLVECLVEHGDETWAQTASAAAGPAGAASSVQRATSVAASRGHTVSRTEALSASRARAQVLQASVMEAFAQATPLATLPLPVIASLLTFAVKATVQQLTVDAAEQSIDAEMPEPDMISRRRRVQMLLRTAFPVALEELSSHNIVHCEADTNASAEVLIVPATPPSSSTIARASSARRETTRSSVRMTAAALSMRARASRACAEAKWVVAPPAPTPSFAACVVAEVLSWIRPARAPVESGKRSFEPLPIVRSRRRLLARQPSVASSVDVVSGSTNPLLVQHSSESALQTSRRASMRRLVTAPAATPRRSLGRSSSREQSARAVGLSRPTVAVAPTP